MAVAGAGPLACDAEPVASRTAEVWQGLLGVDRYPLAELIAGQTAEDLDTAATRVWAAAECLKKAGAALDQPLVFRSATPDHWVLLAAGSLSVATWVGSVQDTKDALAFAVLRGPSQEC
jgi:enediyne polyketide synthase